MREDIQFLKELQSELKTQENDGQAAPRYWSIMDYKWEPSSEDHADRVILYDSDACETIEINDYVDEIVDFEGDRHLEFDKQQRDELKDIRDYEDPSEIYEWIEINDDDSRYYPIYEQEISFIAYNSCFLTKQEAKDHLKANAHHYTGKAHTFAMTAWRAPKMERLIKILETFDWDAVDKLLLEHSHDN
ncbi:hypothetical protein JYK21_07285 [Ralstonia pickettii]|nr:hypothetical protein [Ralstonia pickettii]